MDTTTEMVRVYWEKHDNGAGREFYTAYMRFDDTYVALFWDYDRDAFFRRYNALAVTKEPGER